MPKRWTLTITGHTADEGQRGVAEYTLSAEAPDVYLHEVIQGAIGVSFDLSQRPVLARVAVATTEPDTNVRDTPPEG